ncbi:intradiol ring-cleavage dioxygenase [Actinocrispum sp. NPDC049592]|uniref:intradiol ring-cleavage dioxygenase n=1 Tax=Actinocrispum sp. NPDC049592 TaxID=3154835 RepID=UPI003432F904
MTTDRRRFLAAGGSVGLGALLAACTSSEGVATSSAVVPTTSGSVATVAPQTSSSVVFPEVDSCVLTPEETEGPYYFDVDSIRSDIREDRSGTPLLLAMRVRDAACKPLANAVVDIWHCDATGEYSGFESGTQGGKRTDQKTYLRGAQVTNADGVVQFQTIYPGWYQGRAVHIHFKVHIDKATVLTSQLYFDEKVSDAVYTKQSYAAHNGRRTGNAQDGIFVQGNVLTLTPQGDGYLGVMTVGVESQA